METHIPVLLHEVVDAFSQAPAGTIVDGTLGLGGHTKALLASREDITVIGLDVDPQARAIAEKKLSHFGNRFQSSEKNFRDISTVEIIAEKKISGVLLDLGVSSLQLDSAERGFSFMHDGALDMTLSGSTGANVTATQIVNNWSEESLESIIRGYGEEKFAGRIARSIVEAREKNPITTTFQLRDIIFYAYPGMFRHGRTHPATKTFQAIRIAANDELGALEHFFQTVLPLLAPHAIIAIISFHSLEDRIVKRAFISFQEQQLGTIITKRPITATDQELETNPRSRSAKLRIFKSHA